MVIDMDIYAQIRRYYTERKSIRWIAKRLNVSRQTVRKYCEGNTVPGNRKEYHREAIVIDEEVNSFVRQCLETDATEKLVKQKHTAKRIYDRLCTELGFTGSYSSIRDLVRELKADYTPPRGDLPLVYRPGEAAQIDFGEAVIFLNGERQKIQYFCGRLCYSCAIFVYAGIAQNTETLLEAIQQMFYYFGGVPERVIFDNGSAAVKSGSGKKAIATDRYAGMAAHYVFQTDFCNVASGNEKGLVENLVGFARRNFMVPVPHVKSLSQLNDELRRSCDQYNAKAKISGRNQTVAEQLALEKTKLTAVANYWYDTSTFKEGKVSDYSLVRFDNNNYSVPFRHIGKDVTVKGYALKVKVFYGHELIAEHERYIGRNHTRYVLAHYLDEIRKKPRAVFQARPVIENLSDELLAVGRHLPDGNYGMVRLLTLVVRYTEKAVLEAIHRLAGTDSLTVDMIRAELEPLETSADANSITNDVAVLKTNPAVFDKLWRYDA